ncbi:hypothetical protein LIER_29963 [Lithospermum erythrorhizon]|uniref:Uncharacterized protein n=1 Tax=Lithospermum erythrorhizon TaxID=34254 RepID=A0AAV3RNX9_LITER
MLLPWKEDVSHEEPNPGHEESIQPEKSIVGGADGVQVPLIEAKIVKNRNPSSDSVERVENTNTFINHDGGSKRVDKDVDDMVVDDQHVGVENASGEKVSVPEKVARGVEGINPGVKNTSDETNYKSAKTHSSVDPIVVDILADIRMAR